jgi:hypothetical protein
MATDTDRDADNDRKESEKDVQREQSPRATAIR